MVIGKDNDLPWRLPSDLKYFKTMTDGNAVIMGRKCWESIPEKYRPLPNRKNFVVSRNKAFIAEGAVVTDDFKNILKMYSKSSEQLFVIGGAELYKEAFKHAERLYLTQIYSAVDGDVFLEGLEPKDWCLVDADDIIEENGFKFRFELYEKKNKKNCI
jgi:dihydrofolate reductase